MAKTEVRQKVFHAMLNKGMEKTAKDTLLVRGYFTSDNKDETGDIITRSATERAIPKYRQWMNIRLMHQPIPVGKVRRIGSEDGLEWNELEIEVIDPNAVFMVENGLLPALSVGILVNFEDIDFLEDGGLLINDYQLAEISLVDHPANYDAFLKEIPVAQGLQMMVRQYGLDAIDRTMQQIKEKEIPMETEEVVIEETETKAVEESAKSEQEEVVKKEIVEEEPILEKEIVSEEPEMIEEPIEETITLDLEPESTLGQGEGEEEAQQDPMALFSSASTELVSTFKLIAEEMAQIVSELKSLKTQTEVPEATEQVEGDADEIENVLEPEQLEETEPEPSTAVNRKGAVQKTELPEVADAEQVKKTVKASGLQDALRMHFGVSKQ